MDFGDATLGTLLRALIEMLDGEVEIAYRDAGLDWRPRFTPIMKALVRNGPTPIKVIAKSIGISQSAVSQTVSQMLDKGLLESAAGEDRRERIVSLSATAQAMLPALRRLQAATNLAAGDLESDLGAPLAGTLRDALGALQREPFSTRIARAAEALPST